MIIQIPEYCVWIGTGMLLVDCILSGVALYYKRKIAGYEADTAKKIKEKMEE